MSLKLKSIREKKPEAIVLVGLPASGKSTWAWEFKGGYPVLSPDAHIERMAYDSGLSYKEGVEKFHKMAFAAFRQEVDNYRLERKPFIWDQPNLMRAERESIYRLLSPTHNVTYVCFYVPINECLLRAARRAQEGGNPVDEAHLRKLAAVTEFPSAKSGERYDRIVQLKHPEWKHKVVRA